MNKLLVFLLVFLTFGKISKAQDTIFTIEGKRIVAQKIEINNDNGNYICYKINGKSKSINRNRIYAITDSTGKKIIFYTKIATSAENSFFYAKSIKKNDHLQKYYYQNVDGKNDSIDIKNVFSISDTNGIRKIYYSTFCLVNRELIFGKNIKIDKKEGKYFFQTALNHYKSLKIKDVYTITDSTYKILVFYNTIELINKKVVFAKQIIKIKYDSCYYQSIDGQLGKIKMADVFSISDTIGNVKFYYNSIVSLEGENIITKSFRKTGTSECFYGDLRGNEKEIDIDDIFSVRDTLGKETVYYKQDTLKGFYDSPEEMKQYVYGMVDAKKQYKAPFYTYVGAGVSLFAVTGIVTSGVGYLFWTPLIPVVYTGIILKSKPNVEQITNAIPEKLRTEKYFTGYITQVKRKRVNNAILGSVGGLFLGWIGFFAIDGL